MQFQHRLMTSYSATSLRNRERFSSNSVPLLDAGRFAFVSEAGTGARIFTSERRAVTLGMRFQHISNGDRAGSNRGLNQFVFYAGFSVFK